VHRNRLASLSASLRSGPGGSKRARSNASAASISWSIRSGGCCVSLFIISLATLAISQKGSKNAGLNRLDAKQRYSSPDAFMT
jgi:hypothetical protein